MATRDHETGESSVFKKLGAATLSALLAATLLAVASPAPASAYMPEDGAIFNNPWGRFPAKERLLTKIASTIDAAVPGSTIRIAAYSNDRKDITDALIAAHRRGVHVQVLLNGNWTSRQTTRMQRVLGKNPEKKHFLRICKRSCRGETGNLHSKFFLFTNIGTARHVVMFGSVNLTGFGAKTQWNDLYTSTNRRVLHNRLRKVFNSMKHDRVRKNPFINTAVGDYDITVYPRYRNTEANDPVLNRLKRIRCKGDVGPAGVGGRTMIRINMYGWNGTRGVYLARKVADLSRHGCNIKVLESDAGGRVVQIMARNGVLIKSPDFDRNSNGKVDMFTHTKYWMVGGRYGKASAGWHVWTGSQNWSDRAMRGDELTVHIPRRGVFWNYRQNFRKIWRKHSRWIADTRPEKQPATSTTTRTRGTALDSL
jgi:phosphatidylserine/phosphatidylglycerophosphate/cardiolipin synthase-like enzyme